MIWRSYPAQRQPTLQWWMASTCYHIRSDNGPEFVANAVGEWLGRLGVTTLYIEPGSPWENGYIAIRRMTSASGVPASACFKANAICSCV